MNPAPGPNTNRRMIMVVDGERIIADTVVNILRQHGFNSIAAYDGDEAIELARQFRPCYILMGIMMPRMLGTDAARVILDEHPGCDIDFSAGSAGAGELMKKL